MNYIDRMARLCPTDLDIAWEKINAIGGKAGEYNDFEHGINHAVEQALFIIEELGGSDPAPKRAAAKAEIDKWMAVHDRTIAMLAE